MAKSSVKLPQSYHDLLMDKKAFAHLATKNEDGTLQSTPVWVDFDGQFVLVNTAKGRVKDRNMKQRPQVALSIHDPDDPYRYLEVQGRVAEHTEDSADQHIDKMAQKYLDEDTYPFRQPGEVRVIFKIEPTKFTTHDN